MGGAVKQARVDPRDLIGGAILIGIGLLAMVVASEYPFGTARRMGPGYFPMVLGGITTFLGLAIVIKGFIPAWRDEGVGSPPNFRNIIGISAAVAGFVIIGGRFGLIPGILVLVIVAGLVDRGNSLRTVLLLAATVVAMGVVIFRWGLGIIFPLFDWPV
jgi:hypothetical protein